MAYNPASTADRTSLARALETMLTTCGFDKMEGRPGAEDIYRYRAIGGTEILVYSSIVGSMVRGDGEDAIRVAAVYRRKDGNTRGLFKDTRVNRTGEVDKIVDRTRERMRNAFREIKAHYGSGYVCNKCGAPLFLAKSKNMVCAETCWLTK
jgi:hypothetical protein